MEPVRPTWLAQRREAPIDPERPIVDAHHHFWDNSLFRYMFDDLRKDAESGHNIVATVYLECHSMFRQNGPDILKPVGETEFVNGFSAMSASGKYGNVRICDGIVGFADLREGERVDELLEAHCAAAGSRFKGIRQISSYDV